MEGYISFLQKPCSRPSC